MFFEKPRFFAWFFLEAAPSFAPAPGGCAESGCFVEELMVFCMGGEL